MPGPSKKGKSKHKKAGPSRSGGSLDWASIARDHKDLGDIDNAFEWSVIVNVLCTHFDIPGQHGLLLMLMERPLIISHIFRRGEGLKRYTNSRVIPGLFAF